MMQMHQRRFDSAMPPAIANWHFQSPDRAAMFASNSSTAAWSMDPSGCRRRARWNKRRHYEQMSAGGLCLRAMTCANSAQRIDRTRRAALTESGRGSPADAGSAPGLPGRGDTLRKGIQSSAPAQLKPRPGSEAAHEFGNATVERCDGYPGLVNNRLVVEA